ncbi:MAG TPA: hypothetical protein VIF39_02875 [Hyphomicrobium sp.]
MVELQTDLPIRGAKGWQVCEASDRPEKPVVAGLNRRFAGDLIAREALQAASEVPHDRRHYR